MMLKLGHIEIFVSDVVRARHFYEHVLGFDVTAVQDERFIWLQSGGQEILLRPGRTAEKTADYQSNAVNLVIYTDNMADAQTHLAQNGVTFCGLDGDCPTFTDPDGNWFQLVNLTEHQA